MILYGTALVLSETVTPLLTYVVPVRGEVQINGVILWGDSDGEYIISKNGVQIAGGRTSSANRTLQIDYEAAKFILSYQDTLVVSVIQHELDSQNIHCNLIINLL